MPDWSLLLTGAMLTLVASLLTFYTGFGLGTLLLPVFAAWLPVETAVSLTAVVHLANNLMKVGVIGRHADRATLFQFGVPAVFGALIGAQGMVTLAQMPGTWTYALPLEWGTAQMTPVKLLVGGMMLAMAALELMPRFQQWAVPPQWVSVGGLLSGLLGGLTGHQGALRSAFLLRVGLSKEAFLGTVAWAAVLVDISRLTVYRQELPSVTGLPVEATLACIGAAILGTWIAKRGLPRMNLAGIRVAVGVLLILYGVLLAAGWI
jgi:uncharacterized membrane protein YfcA